ncbi:hypothetical protein A3F62_04845 [Candidatus Woesebacteria bacterium RIFCSPHIGHO2_12_FULL_44_11]|nr:MAG: hypothetical protein A3F62_04845 [Candidatus Woesebacteria bacterium RIFCSPHIGHO2_12_FULL_44_11]
MSNDLISFNQPQEAQKLQFDSLTDTEKRTLLAMMVASSDREAISLAPIGSRRFYQLKPKLQEMMEQIKNDLSAKSWQVLTGSVIEAAQTLVRGLKQPSYKYQLESAKNILDRILGQPMQKIEARGQITVLGIEMSKDQVDSLTKPETADGEVLETIPENLEVQSV